ncbi:TIGR01777 family oxidoreductase [Thorsellia anophelis]|uniref:TIGR01777 family protein n=1 Tax=Thorsellia anophelis DSM 18579 TaxID=1123402 RepID=A0A1I0APT9_9GAMM|nr:TIGR01777 family oxidoreductase [Thorsellia anophelis]SES95457.1 hypothetical protein SAMN02583745_00978 [Thorsellia anophelis DSM 18579]
MNDLVLFNPLYDLVITLLIIQALLGAFDTIYHHEIRVALPQKRSARLELFIHSIRSMLYGLFFFLIAHFSMHGNWVFLMITIILIEIGLTLWDFIVEDNSRKLPAIERILHTILAINGGAIFGLYFVTLAQWHNFSTEIVSINLGWRGWVLTLFAVGVSISGIRDLLASLKWKQKKPPENPFINLPFSRFLITGGTGFIGSYLVRQLLEAKHEVVVLSRNPLNAAYLFNAKARIIKDLSELSYETEFDIVINLAGQPIWGLPWSEKRKAHIMASRVGTTEKLTTWFKQAKHPPKLVIQASAIGFYGVRDPNEILTESSQKGSGFMAELCYEWEQSAKQFDSNKTRLTIFRLGVVLGYGGIFPLMLLPYYFGLGGKIGSGSQIMSWIHIEDVMGTFAHAIANPNVNGTYNLVAPETLSQAKFALIVSQWAKRPLLLNIPAKPISKLLGEMSELIIDGQNVSSIKLIESGVIFKYPTMLDTLNEIRTK